MKNIVRILFLGLIAFELLNWVGILHFTLDFSWLGLVGTAIAVWLTLELVRLFPYYIWWSALTGVYLDSLADIGNLYTRFESWDRWMHLLGGALMALVMLSLITQLKNTGKLSLEDQWIPIAVIFSVAFVGFVYEGWEFVIDKVYFGYHRALGDGPDTVDDMFLNLLGAMIVTIAYRFQKINKPPQR